MAEFQRRSLLLLYDNNASYREGLFINQIIIISHKWQDRARRAIPPAERDKPKTPEDQARPVVDVGTTTHNRSPIDRLDLGSAPRGGGTN